MEKERLGTEGKEEALKMRNECLLKERRTGGDEDRAVERQERGG